MIVLALFGCRQRLSPGGDVGDDPIVGWNQVLSEVVDDDGYVDYDALEKKREPLDHYVAWLSYPLESAKEQSKRHAYWINAYNSLVIYSILELKIEGSIDEFDGAMWPGHDFFTKTSFKVGADWLSLQEIQHERVRMKNMDVRDFGALNWGAKSCPPLRSQLFNQRRMSANLHNQMVRWINDPDRGVYLDVDKGEAVFPAQFEWHERDMAFWSNGESLCGVAKAFAESPLDIELEALDDEGCPHRFRTFDWSLNKSGG